MARRIKITVAYDGTDFHGWQVQPGLPTIQHTLQEVLSGIEEAPVVIAGSGRTDAGVHARAQVAAFSLVNPIPPDNLRRAMNRLLPASVRITAVEEVHDSFHPRFDAVAKTYEYRLFRGEVCDPFLWRYVHHYPYPVRSESMLAVANAFEGEHDFSPFAAADGRDSEQRSKVRRIFSSELFREGDLMIYRVRGSGFLKHMVRNLVGYLLEAGKGNVSGFPPPDRRVGPTAPAKGLTLHSVEF